MLKGDKMPIRLVEKTAKQEIPEQSTTKSDELILETQPPAVLPVVTQTPIVISQPKEKLEISAIEGMPSNFIMMFGERPFVLKTGLLWKMQQVYGSKHFSIKAEPIKGTWEGEPATAVYRGTVEITNDKGEAVATFIDIGVARPANVNNTRLHSQLDQLAATRATNRAMRLALAMGYCSVEELPETEST